MKRSTGGGPHHISHHGLKNKKERKKKPPSHERKQFSAVVVCFDACSCVSLFSLQTVAPAHLKAVGLPRGLCHSTNCESVGTTSSNCASVCADDDDDDDNEVFDEGDLTDLENGGRRRPHSARIGPRPGATLVCFCSIGNWRGIC